MVRGAAFRLNWAMFKRRYNTDAALEILAGLVGFPTVSVHDTPPGTYKAKEIPQPFEGMARYLHEISIRAGVSYRRFPAPLPSPDYPVLHYHQIETNPEIPERVIISGHLDVVTASSQRSWKATENAFELVHDDGAYFGRGTVDMKGSIACALASLEHLRKMGTANFTYILTEDEEEGNFLSAQNAVDRFGGDNVLACFIIEPTILDKESGLITVVPTGKVENNQILETNAAVEAYLIGLMNHHHAAPVVAPFDDNTRLAAHFRNLYSRSTEAYCWRNLGAATYVAGTGYVRGVHAVDENITDGQMIAGVILMQNVIPGLVKIMQQAANQDSLIL